MKKLLIIVSAFISFTASAQIDQKFGAFARNLDSLYTHTGRQLQPVTVLGRFSPNDGFAALYYYDSLSTATEIPYQVIKVVGTDTGRWLQMQLLSSGGGGDTSIFNAADFAVIDILTTPPGSPTTGDVYLAGIGSAGAWIGEDNDIQEWNGSSWDNTTPTIGQLLINATNTGVYKYTAGGWIQLVLVLHDGGDNYGDKDQSAGNKANRGFYLKTNNINRVKIDSIGRTYIYNTPSGTAGTDSVLVQSGGLIKKISPTYYSTGGSSGTTADSTLTASASQTAFTFSSVPSSYADYIIFRNGVAIEPVTYFTTSSNTITFISGMDSGDKIRFKRIK